MIRSTGHTSKRAPFLLLAMAAAFVVACDDGDPSGPASSLPHITTAQVVDTAGSIFRSLRVDVDEPASVEVYYAPVDDAGRTFRMRSETAPSHDVLMPRLLAEKDYRFAARVFDGGVASDSVVRGTFNTGSLPEDLRTMDYAVEGQGTFPLLLFGHAVEDGFRGHIGMEPDGSIVWYTTEIARAMAATPIPDSDDILMITREGVDGIARIGPRGHVVDTLPRSELPDGGLHHDIATLDEDRVAMIALDKRTVRDTVVAGEAVWVWNMETGDLEKVWSSWDHFDWDEDRGPRSRPDDWLHANALSVGPRGNLLMSLHFLDQVISIAPDYQSIEWRLGGTNATIRLSESDQFHGQHSAFELDDGNVLLFDNQYRTGTQEPAEYSRGLELEIDGDTARVAWEYVPDPPVWARIISGIYPLDNGNRVVTFATPPSLFTVHEADETGQRVWRLFGDGLSVSFRAVPWPAIAGEERVDAMP